MKKNILFVIGKYPNYGGTEKVTTVLANHFVKMGNKVVIVSFEQPLGNDRKDLNEQIKLVNLSLPVNSKSNINILRGIILNDQISIIINQWCLPFFVTNLINKCRKGTSAKLISVLHGMPDRSKKVIVAENAIRKANNSMMRNYYRLKLVVLEKVIKWSIRYVYNNSDRYVVLSESFIKTFQTYTKLVNTPKLLCIGNPITIQDDNSSDIISSKKKQILYVGRMDLANKRVDRIIETWNLLYKDFKDWNLLLVGDGPDRPKLEAMVSDNKIQRVFFTGFVSEEPVRFYKESSILMLTSDLEGFGLVIVEGMSLGVVPVVYGSYGSVYDIIENDKQGIILPVPFCSQIAASYMRDLMSDSMKRNIMSHQANERSKDFSLDTIEMKWIELFNEVCHESK